MPFPECYMASLVAQTVKHLPAMWETWVQSLGQEDPLEKEMATHSSTRAWKTPYMEESGGLPAMGSQRVRQHWVTSISECYMVGFIKYVAFSDWLLLFSNEHLWFLHVFSWLDSSLLLVFYFIIIIFYYFSNNIPLSEGTNLFILSPTKGHFCCFQVLAITNKAVTNTSSHMLVK